MRRIPRKRRGERNRFFQAEGVDELLSALLRLSAELSALKDRVYIAEKVLEQQGLNMSDAIEAYELSTEQESEWRIPICESDTQGARTIEAELEQEHRNTG